MRWLWVVLVVVSGTLGDALSAKGMAERGEIQEFNPVAVARVMQYICTHPAVLGGIGANAVSFLSFLILLAIAPLSFAVPATAFSYILKTVVAHFWLGERVDRSRWIGVALVACGIVLIAF